MSVHVWWPYHAENARNVPEGLNTAEFGHEIGPHVHKNDFGRAYGRFGRPEGQVLWLPLTISARFWGHNTFCRFVTDQATQS